MSVTERLMAAGQWALQLDPTTPYAVRSLLAFDGHVFIFNAPPRSGLSDVTMISGAQWSGVLRRTPTAFGLAGANTIIWLGDEESKGPILEANIGAAGTAFATYLAALLAICPAVTAGTATAVAGTRGAVYTEPLTVRAALDNLCAVFGAEYRVNKDATIDTAPVGSSAIFAQTPTAIAMKRSSGRDLSIVGLSVTQLDVATDAEDYFTRSLVQDTTLAWTAAAGSAPPYNDMHGNVVKFAKAAVSSSTANADAPTLAANLVAAGQVLHREVSLAVDDYAIRRFLQAGDRLGVYDIDGNLTDPTNPVRYQGAIIYPATVRINAVTWPIEQGMGVWYRDKVGFWTNLTNYVLWEQPGVTFEVGAPVRALTKS